MLSRRHFLQSLPTLSAAGISMLSLRPLLAGQAAPVAARASQLIAGKSDELLVHTADPLVFESPIRLLDQHVVTPNSLLFVRSNVNPAGMSTTAPAPVRDWPVELTGLVEGTKSIDLNTLQSLPRTSYEMVLQCSGNGRSMFSKAAKTSGTQWGRGGIGNVHFEGVKLSEVLKHLDAHPHESARYIAAEGKDSPAPGKDDFEHSIPLGDALETAILALSMNGEPLPAIHGGPVRLVLPGYYGTVQMKWLGKLRFEAEESDNPFHAVSYRTPDRIIQPGAKYVFNRSNSTPTWKAKLASLVTSHTDGQTVAPGVVKLAGYAWNDGAAPLKSVLLSTDHGETWQSVALTRSRSPYAWSRWSVEVPVKPGARTFWITAVDALGRTQPHDGAITWNPAGYEWNGVEKLTLLIG